MDVHREEPRRPLLASLLDVPEGAVVPASSLMFALMSATRGGPGALPAAHAAAPPGPVTRIPFAPTPPEGGDDGATHMTASAP